MAVAEAAVPHFEMGRVMKRSFSVIAHNIGTFAALSLIPGIPLAAFFYIAVSTPRNAAGTREPSDAATVLILLAFVAYIIAAYVLQAAVMHSTVAFLNGRRAALSNCISTGVSQIVSLFLIALLTGIGIMIGMVLLIAPGIILAVAWLVAVPARVVERTGVIDSMSRSRTLTRGHRWPIFGLWVAFGLLQVLIFVLITIVVGIGVRATIGTPATNLETSTPLAVIVVAEITAAMMINAIISAASVASIYYELRVLKDGIGPESLASVFD